MWRYVRKDSSSINVERYETSEDVNLNTLSGYSWQLWLRLQPTRSAGQPRSLNCLFFHGMIPWEIPTCVFYCALPPRNDFCCLQVEELERCANTIASKEQALAKSYAR